MTSIASLFDVVRFLGEQGYYIVFNYGIALLSSILVSYSLFNSPERFVRPAFMVAVMVMVFYQWPLILFSLTFYEETPNAWWLAISIHSAVLVNFLWVKYTPHLNNKNIYKKPANNELAGSFSQFELWFSTILFFMLVSAYLYRVPPTCTALYSIFFDPGLALLIRELAVKLVGTNYATYALSILASTVSPIVIFLAAHMIYQNCRIRKFIWIPLWFFLIIAVVISNLLSGAKGNLIPTFVAVSVAGFLSANKWYWRIIIVIILNAMLIFILSFLSVQRTAMNIPEKKDYQFGRCVVALNACKETKLLLDSLKARDFSLDLTKDTIYHLEKDADNACNPHENKEVTDSIAQTKNYNLVKSDSTSKITQSENDISPAENKNISHKNIENITPLKESSRSVTNLTPTEAFIASEHNAITGSDRISSLINRAFITPIVVADWHFLYVAEYGAPGFSGLSIAKKFTDNYINMPSKICEIYEFIRSGGDKTSTCTAPTSYLFTYPAYMGIVGLLLASLATIAFDIIGALIIKYSMPPISYLAVGLMAVAGINFMTADFTTVMMSHGAGTSLAILAFFCICRLLIRRSRGKQD